MIEHLWKYAFALVPCGNHRVPAISAFPIRRHPIENMGCISGLGFIGWGAMAQAVSLGLLKEKLTDTSKTRRVHLSYFFGMLYVLLRRKASCCCSRCRRVPL